MSRAIIGAACAILTTFTCAVAQDTTAATKAGAQAYRVCAACHSLKPGINLSGPSLAGLWGRKAGTADEYFRYTDALKKADIVWDENTLDPWINDPQATVAGTTMMFRGIEDAQTRANLIAFLRLGTGPNGAEKVVEAGMIPESMAEGQVPPSLNDAGPEQRIASISHCHDAFLITTSAGEEYPLWETNVRIKIDTSERGPGAGKPVLLHSGMVGDRFSIVFSSLEQLRTLLDEKC